MERNWAVILAGEIGATRTRLAAFESEGNQLRQVVEKIYLSQEHTGLAEIIPDFIKSEGIPVVSACFGVAGPVVGADVECIRLRPRFRGEQADVIDGDVRAGAGERDHAGAADAAARAGDEGDLAGEGQRGIRHG